MPYGPHFDRNIEKRIAAEIMRLEREQELEREQAGQQVRDRRGPAGASPRGPNRPRHGP
jgi:hypothetical protein